MPWTAGDAKSHTAKAKTAKLQRMWAEVANSVRTKCIADGGSEEACDAKGITQANGVIAKAVQESEMDSEWTMASVAQTAIEIGLAVARETGEIENDEAAKTLALLRSKMNEIGEAQASIASIADVDIGGEHVSFADIVEFYRASRQAEKEKETQEMDEPTVSEPAITMKVELSDAMKAVATLAEYFASHPGEVADVTVETQEPSTEVKEDAVEVAEDAPPVEEPLIEFDEGDAETATFEIDGHALMIVEDVDGATPAAPLKLNFVVIEPGFGNKKMKRYYPAPMLRENASKFKGAKMYTTNHKENEKSVRTEAGIVLECPVGFTETGGIIGQAGIFDEAFARNVRNRAALGVLGSLENSVYGDGPMRKGKVNGQEAYVVEGVNTVGSVDWVTKAGAGGRALEIVENSDGGESIMMEEVVEEVAVAIDEPVVVEEAPPADTVETEGDVQEMMIAEAVVSTVDKAKLPEAFKNALKVQEWADEASLEAGIAQAVEDYKAATGSGKPFGQGQPTQKKVAETEETPMERRLKRYNRILAEVGHSS